jgi:hypothetical protein
MATTALRVVGPTTDHPVQLTFQLCGTRQPGATRTTSSPRPYWTHVDTADVGGELQARNQSARVRIGAHQSVDGTWTGYYDACFAQSGASGPIRTMSSRQDVLASAAYSVARHCRWVLANTQPRDSLRAAREVLRWLEVLDLL